MELICDDSHSLLASEGRLIVLSTRSAPTSESTERFADALRDHAGRFPSGRLFMLAALGADRPRLDPEVRSTIIALWRNLGHRYVVAMWARRQSFAGSLQRSFITALSLLRIRKTPMRLVNGCDAALDFFNKVEPDTASVRSAWQAMLDSVEDFKSPPS